MFNKLKKLAAPAAAPQVQQASEAGPDGPPPPIPARPSAPKPPLLSDAPPSSPSNTIRTAGSSGDEPDRCREEKESFDLERTDSPTSSSGSTGELALSSGSKSSNPSLSNMFDMVKKKVNFGNINAKGALDVQCVVRNMNMMDFTISPQSMSEAASGGGVKLLDMILSQIKRTLGCNDNQAKEAVIGLRVIAVEPYDFKFNSINAKFCCLPQMEELYLEHHSLGGVPPQLAQFSTLRVLRLPHCSIKAVPTCLADMTTVQTLDLKDNSIERLGKQASRVFPASLTYLDLSENNVTSLPSDLGEHALGLKTLLASHNKIKQLPILSNAMVFMDVSYNSLQSAGGGVFGKGHDPIGIVCALSNLTHFNCCYNKLESLPELNALSKLSFLDASHNNLSSLPDLSGCTALQEMNVSSNKIDKVPPTFGGSQALLETLDLSSNRLSSLPNTIATCNRMRTLNLNFNKFSFIPIGLGELKSLTDMNLSENQINTLTSGLFNRMPQLEILSLRSNCIGLLPPDIGCLTALRGLNLSNNEIRSVPQEIGNLTVLEELLLANNKLETLPSSIAQLQQLTDLALHTNPLSSLPREFMFLQNLTTLSVANIRIDANDDEAPISSIAGSGVAQMMAVQLMALVRSSPHPLLMLVMHELAKEPSYREQIQITLSTFVDLMGDDKTEVRYQAVKAVQVLASTESMCPDLIKMGVFSRLMSLLQSESKTVVAAMDVLVLLSDTVDARRDFVEGFGLDIFCQMLESSSDIGVRGAARKVLAMYGVIPRIDKSLLSDSNEGGRRPLRILCMDGGGTRAICGIQVLKEIEKRTGKRICDLFDLICGTSTGGILASCVGVMKYSMDEVETIYRSLCKQVFSITGKDDSKAGALVSYSSMAKNVMGGLAKYNTKNYEKILKEYFGDMRMIDSAACTDAPRVFMVGTMMSVVPARPFIFRNYGYCDHSDSALASRYEGSVFPHVWQVVRATSAAPSMFAELNWNRLRFQDGGLMANNPAAIAYHEARKVWGKDHPIGCLVSLGTGRPPDKRNEKQADASMKIQSIVGALIESAAEVERTDETLSDFLPENVYFRFNPVHEACDCLLDETREEKLDAMMHATHEYMNEEKQQKRMEELFQSL